QALQIFPYVLYLDSGITILGSLENIFKHIRQNGYFLIGSVTDIRSIATSYVVQTFGLNLKKNARILDQIAISANIQGLSQEMYRNYVYPMYELSRDIRNFQDDGSCPEGFGWGRCDQTLYSIFAYYLNLHIFKFLTPPGYGELKVGWKKIKMRL